MTIDIDLIIYDQIKKKEEQEREDNRPFLELPLPEDDRYFNDVSTPTPSPEPKRVIVIDL